MGQRQKAILLIGAILTVILMICQGPLFDAVLAGLALWFLVRGCHAL
jgi:hypothetical protein